MARTKKALKPQPAKQQILPVIPVLRCTANGTPVHLYLVEEQVERGVRYVDFDIPTDAERFTEGYEWTVCIGLGVTDTRNTPTQEYPLKIIATRKSGSTLNIGMVVDRLAPPGNRRIVMTGTALGKADIVYESQEFVNIS